MTKPTRRSLHLFFAVAGAALLAAGPSLSDERAALDTDEQRTVYALGAQLGTQVKPLDLDAAELRALQQGLEDAVRGRELELAPQEYQAKFHALRTERMKRVAVKEHEASKAFLEEAAREKGAVKLDSGLVYREIKAGDGPHPKPESRVRVHYEGTLRDGSVFDSSISRGEPASFALNRVIPCWTEGLQRMKPGGKSVLVCPASIAYGDRGHPPTIPPGAALRFEVELLEIVQ